MRRAAAGGLSRGGASGAKSGLRTRRDTKLNQSGRGVFTYEHIISQLSTLEVELLYKVYRPDFQYLGYDPRDR